jgi:hypothetical protein
MSGSPSPLISTGLHRAVLEAVAAGFSANASGDVSSATHQSLRLWSSEERKVDMQGIEKDDPHPAFACSPTIGSRVNGPLLCMSAAVNSTCAPGNPSKRHPAKSLLPP